MNQWERLTMATSAALTAFRRVYSDPGALTGTDPDDDRLIDYRLLWAYYQNSVFDDLAAYAGYRSRYRLYRHIRPIYNPAKRLTLFYAGSVYRGAWPNRPQQMTEIDAAIPFEEDTDPRLLAAVAQLFRWSNWQANKNTMITHGAALGDAFTVITDDAARGKVYFQNIWPGHVAEIELDAAGNVKAYKLEYPVVDEDDTARGYVYARIVDKERIATFRDGKPHGYDDQPAEIPNPYGFVPAVWVQHSPTGDDHGQPALRNPSKMDELNSLASAAMDQAQRILNAPILIAGENISGMSADKAGPTADRAPVTVDREAIKIVTAGSGASIETIRLEAGETLEHIDRMIREIEADHPELTMYQQMREMSQITGPAADRLFGDVAALVDAARAQYDSATIKLCQMGIAIAGWRLSTGAWPQPNRQQAAFAGYDLGSYEAGDLDMAIRSRPLFPPSENELIAAERERLTLDADRSYYGQPGAADEPTANRQPASVARRLRAQLTQETATQ